MLELNALRHFMAVAESRSFSRAARKLFVTQPAVSHQIRGLERSLGVALFQRNPGTVALTDAGRYLQEFCIDLFGRLTEVETTLKNLQKSIQGTLRCASPSGIADTWLLPRLIAFQKANPRVDYRVTVGRDESVRNLLQERQVDFGIVLDRIAAAGTGLKHIPVFEEEYVLLVPGGSGRKRRPPKADDVVFRRPFVVVEENDYMLKRWLDVNYPDRAGEIRIGHVVNHIPAIITMVKAGLGMGVLPRHAVVDAIESGQVSEVSPPKSNVTNRFFLVYREQHPMPYTLGQAVEFLAREAP
ncbi:MAG: LysR family transcriptional regulator [Candidatus Wallbacteria bacterium]|nr:LysR family transcriptional regulator [Candidatus Wallbacteria bacterium]